MFDFFWVPIVAAGLCVLVILFLRPLAFKGGLLDRPGGRKRHEGDVPLVGGIAVTIAVWIGLALFLRTQGYYVAFLGGLTILAAAGVLDDLRGMQPTTKLGVELVAGILMTSWGGIYLNSLGDLLGRREIELANWGIPLTLLAVLAVVNAVNMSDGLDGLAGGLALIIFGWMAYLSGEVGNLPAQRILMVLCGALVGFLLFNLRNPFRGSRRVFLGDAGSLMLGFCIVWFSIELSQKQYNGGQHIPPVVMLWVVGFLLIDFLAVILRRAVKGRNPMLADRTHLHHVLMRLDISSDVSVWIILASNALMGLIGVLAWKYGISEQGSFLLFLLVTLAHILIMRNAWRFIRASKRILRRR